MITTQENTREGDSMSTLSRFVGLLRPFAIRRTHISMWLASATAAWAMLHGMSAMAMNPEWEWKVVVEPSQTFPTKMQAVAYMRSLTNLDPNYPLLVVERKVSDVSPRTETFQYEGIKLTPTTDAWRYQNVSQGGSAIFSSESALLAYWLANLGQSAPQCTPISGAPTGAWSVSQSSYGGIITMESRIYQFTRYTYNATTGCNEYKFNQNFRRTRSIACPNGYGGETPAPGCYLQLKAQIRGILTYSAGKCFGNPCDALTGDKVETANVYRGPFGLDLTLHYHSRGLDDTGDIGVGWTHNFQKQLVINAASQLLGLSRSGVREDMLSVSTPTTHYVSTSASGIVVRKITSTLWKAFLNDGSVEHYNGNGTLTALQDPAGRTTTLAYGADGKLASVTGPFGHTLTFVYGTDGLISSVTTPGGQSVVLTHSNKNLVQVTQTDGVARTFHYENTTLPNHLTGITAEDSQRLSTFTYDTMGRATSTTRFNNVGRYDFVYNASNTLVTDPLGTVETVSFTTDASYQRRLTGTSKPGQTKTFSVPTTAVDAQRRPTQETDARGNVTTYTYSTYAMTQKTEAFGTPEARTTGYQYLSTDSDKPTSITEPNRTTAFTYDTAGNVLTRTVTDTATSASRTWTYTYDTYGRVLTENGPRTDVSDVTTYTYNTCTTGNGCGALATITNALGHVTTINSYNSHGQPLQITDPNGTVTTLTYDSRQRLLSRTVAGETTSFTYWATGLLRRVTQPSGAYLEYTYDAAQRLVQIADTEGNRIAYTLDAMGNRTAEQVYDPGNVLTRAQFRTYDLLNRLTQDIGAANTAAVATSFTYDANNNPTQVAAPLARTTANVYDALNRLKQTTDPALGVTQYGYNANDELTSVTDPKGLVTSYTYNGLGDRLTLTSPDTGVTSYTYDSGGNMATSTDARGKLATYSYDALNRVTQIVYADQTQTFSYDSGTNGKGRLTGVTDSSGSTAWTYDPLGRVTSKTQVIGTLSKTIAYGYNAAGQLATITYPSGVVVTYAYTNGKVTSITSPSQTLLSGILYEPFGPVRGWLWGNGTPSARVFDQDGRPTQIDSAGLKTYTYDNASRITAIADAQNSALSWTYGYDPNDRLTSANSTSLTQSFTFDANGNRLTQGGSTSVTLTPASTSNRLLQTTGGLVRTYSYDAAGNTLSDGTATFTYSDAGRMLTATKSGLTTTYAYNALGQRVKKSSTSATAHFVYDEAGHLLGEYDAAGNVRQEFIWLGDTPVAVNDALPTSPPYWTYYLHTDHLNTVRRVTRIVSPTVVWRWDSDAFGTTAANDDPDGDSVPFKFNLRFPGQYFDSETGLNYNYYRDYDANVGRYTQSDPIGLTGGVNTYSYVSGNSISYSDPDGLQVVVPIPPPLPPPPTPGTRAPANTSYVEIDWLKDFGHGVVNGARNIGQAVRDMCTDDDDDTDDNCEALYQSTLRTCASLSGRKQFRCFEAARKNRDQCYQQRNRDRK